MQLKLDAWDGMFTDKQWDAIRQMSIFADKKGFKLHEAISQRIGMSQKKQKDHKDSRYVRKSAGHFEKPCVQDGCSGVMELYSVCCSDKDMKKQGYFTKWECNECGKVEYSKQSLNDARKFLTEGKNGTSK